MRTAIYADAKGTGTASATATISGIPMACHSQMASRSTPRAGPGATARGTTRASRASARARATQGRRITSAASGIRTTSGPRVGRTIWSGTANDGGPPTIKATVLPLPRAHLRRLRRKSHRQQTTTGHGVQWQAAKVSTTTGAPVGLQSSSHWEPLFAQCLRNHHCDYRADALRNSPTARE